MEYLSVLPTTVEIVSENVEIVSGFVPKNPGKTRKNDFPYILQSFLESRAEGGTAPACSSPRRPGRLLSGFRKRGPPLFDRGPYDNLAARSMDSTPMEAEPGAARGFGSGVHPA